MRALITGVNGQDGAYLARTLIQKGYEVIGTSRDAENSIQNNLINLGISDQVTLVSLHINDFRDVAEVLRKYRPDEIYLLAGQSSVGLSFSRPVQSIEEPVIGLLNFLEAVKILELDCRIYNAGSSECFGDNSLIINEESRFEPKSPYAVGKASAYWLASNYRDAYGIHISTGFLFNHESPLRPNRFVTKKIINGARDIHLSKKASLKLGNIEVCRDWGWAEEYVETMWLMLQEDRADDYVVATGRTESLRYFLDITFKYFDLDWKDFVEFDTEFIRPNDLNMSHADPSKIRKSLGWKAKYDVDDVVRFMCEDLCL